MLIKKPKFWDQKKPNLFSYILLPLTWIVVFLNFFKKKNKKKIDRIKTICVGNIYIGGTGKTPLCIKINTILNNLNYKTAFIKKKYFEQIDEQILLKNNGKLICEKNRIQAIKIAIKDNVDVAILDDGLQDTKIGYDLSFVCFNIKKWIGNGFLIPSGPLREKINNIKKYDAAFLNGNGEDVASIKEVLFKIKPNLNIFQTLYSPINIEKFNLNENYLVFSGIGNPETFLDTLKKNKFKITKQINFPDHYNFSNEDIKKIKEEAKKNNCKIITTEKDYNRLSKINSNEIDFLKIQLEIINEKEFIDYLVKKL